MIKEHNVGRIILAALIGISIDGLIGVNLIIEVIRHMIGESNSLSFYISWDFLMLAVIVVLYNNTAYHVMSESSTKILIDESAIKYKTLFTRERTISTQDVKKIVFCNEVIFPRGEYSSMIIFLKGFKRVIIISEYTMQKEKYANILMQVKTHMNEELLVQRGKFYKPFLMLFGW